MEAELSEALAIVILWLIREFVGSRMLKNERNDLKDIVRKNSKHIEENRILLAKIKNRIN